MTDNALLTAVLGRRSIKPKRLTDPFPDTDSLETAARAALRAPDHDALVPFRFVVIGPGQRARLGELFAAAAAKLGADEAKIEKSRSKAFKGPGLVAFIVHIRDGADVPACEQWLTAGAALDQFLLAMQAQGYGGIVLSGSVLEDDALQAAFCAEPGERLVAWITLGTPAEPAAPVPDEREAPITDWSPLP